MITPSDIDNEITPVNTVAVTNSKRLVEDRFTSNLVSSAAAGTTIAYTFFPAESYKKYLQLPKDDRGTFRPYKGSLLFAANIVPTTAIHMVTHGLIESATKGNSSGIQKMVESFYCGVQGAMFATVMENIVLKVNQKSQAAENKPLDILKNMYKQGGVARLWKSYSMVATRDGIFTAYMLWGGNKGYEFAQKNLPAPWSYLGNLGVGVIGTVLSHPFDMTGAHMQRTDEKITARQAAKEIYQADGIKGFYRGVAPRFIMFFAFGNIIPFVKNHIDGYIDNPTKKIEEINKAFTGYTKSSSAFFASNKKDGPKPSPQPGPECVDLRAFKK